MRRSISALAVTVLGSALLAGCSSPNEYSPSASPTNLSAYAAQAKFPMNAQPKTNADLTSLISSDGSQITVRNFGPGAMNNFNLWVNQTYVVHVDRLDANSVKVFPTSLFYNSAGNSLSGAGASDIKTIQIVQSNGDLVNVQGPQVEQ